MMKSYVGSSGVTAQLATASAAEEKRKQAFDSRDTAGCVGFTFLPLWTGHVSVDELTGASLVI